MDRHRNPPFETTGKVVRIVPKRRGRPTTLDVAMVNEERAMRRREQRAVVWLDGAWAVLAWTVSVFRLRLAVVHHEVFGLETTLAFLVAVALPFLKGRRIVAGVRTAAIALKQARARRAARHDRNDEPTADRQGRAGRPLQ
jgi:hypothetical protein